MKTALKIYFKSSTKCIPYSKIVVGIFLKSSVSGRLAKEKGALHGYDGSGTRRSRLYTSPLIWLLLIYYLQFSNVWVEYRVEYINVPRIIFIHMALISNLYRMK